MPRPTPTILIADDADGTRTFGIVRDGGNLTIYEVFDDGEAPPSGTVVAMPGGNGDLLLLETWGERDRSVASLHADAERVAAALEEIEFRDDHRRGEGGDDE